MATSKSGFPGISRNSSQTPSESAITENIEILTGQRGDLGNRALLYKDLINLDEMKRQALINNARSGGNNGSLPITTTGGIEAPHKPLGVVGVGGFTFIAIRWDSPTYRGHAYAEIWRSEGNIFSDATLIATEVTDIFSDTVNMGSAFYYWVRFVNVADMKGPIHATSAVFAETQDSAEEILNKLGGKIEKSHLGEFLTSDIEKISFVEDTLRDIDLESISELSDRYIIDIGNINDNIARLDGEVEDAQQYADEAREGLEVISYETESIARQIINAALVGDENWRNNTQKLIDFESSVEGINARITAEFLTKTEANEAIAAAAETIKVLIEENGIALTSDIENTYYTKATADSAISIATNELKSAIEDTNGGSVGALLFNDYLTTVETNEAISAHGTQLKSIIEDPDGNSIGANLITNYYTKAGVDDAVTQLSESLGTTIEGVSSSLTNNYMTTVDTNAAIASAAQLLKSTIENPEGDSLGSFVFNEIYTKSDVDSAISSTVEQLNSSYSNINNAIIENALANDISNQQRIESEANILQQQTAISDGVSALAKTITKISTEFNDSSASITQLRSAFASETEATTQKTDQLLSKINENQAFLESAYLTEIDTNFAISAAETRLQGVVDDVSSNITVNYVTKTLLRDSISEANLLLESKVSHDREAILQQSYLTKVDTESAITASTQALKSEIEDPDGNSIGAILINDYQTKADSDSSQASLTQRLRSEYEQGPYAVIENALANDLNIERRLAIEADLLITKEVLTDEQKSTAKQLFILNTSFNDSRATIARLEETFSDAETSTAQIIEGISASIKSANDDFKTFKSDIENNYYTKATADSARTASINTLRSIIEDENGDSVGATLQVIGNTVVSNDQKFEAMWGVNTSVNGIESSFGLINDGADPLFAIKGAKFAIINESGDDLTPVFAVSDGKTVINTAIIDEAFIKSLVTDDLLANRLLVSSRLTTPSINYNPSNGARSSNFSIDPNGNMLAKSATLQSVTIKDNNGNVVMSSTGAIPSSKVTGLGDLASKDSLGYNELSGRPNLGTFAFLSSLGYSDLSGRPTLGSLASKNSLSYNEVTGKPSLGSLAYLNSLAYNSITGKPSLGPFAGLSKILSSNVTTYIANGAIGSAQIDTAYINSLFGQNASFYGTVYAQNLEGDVYDVLIKEGISLSINSSGDTIVSFSISPEPFARKVEITGIKCSGYAAYEGGPIYGTVDFYRSGSSSIVSRKKASAGEEFSNFIHDIPANTSRTYTAKLNQSTSYRDGFPTVGGDIRCSVFKKASSIS
ncbi:hypothetical protein [Pseudoalteromonas sp. APC 3691]|uniref:phage tail tip fiber protein n=1 Tax=Pseudoalteromonas sp. APC 3691 TaxID=3035173 RepID=UPI0025B3E1EA|nr:hypothetical protein [Pseudoalteromonas sp. APC 3691]MDN3390855.1 hypothetical protein [Pseudoalteromonas sp. APC 3691]